MMRYPQAEKKKGENVKKHMASETERKKSDKKAVYRIFLSSLIERGKRRSGRLIVRMMVRCA